MLDDAQAEALVPIPFRGGTFYGEAPEIPMTQDDLSFLLAMFEEHLDLALPFIQSHHCHVFVPLSGPEEGYHVAFSGKVDLEDLRMFFRRAPNALTVVDGRPWGFFRIRLNFASGRTWERVAEIEVHTAQDSAESGFELFWGMPEELPTHIRMYDRSGGAFAQQVGHLVTKWGDRIRKLTGPLTLP